MTVNERLWHAGLMEGFDEAIAARDPDSLRRILKELYLDEAAIEEIIVRSLGGK